MLEISELKMPSEHIPLIPILVSAWATCWRSRTGYWIGMAGFLYFVVSLGWIEFWQIESEFVAPYRLGLLELGMNTVMPIVAAVTYIVPVCLLFAPQARPWHQKLVLAVHSIAFIVGTLTVDWLSSRIDLGFHYTHAPALVVLLLCYPWLRLHDLKRELQDRHNGGAEHGNEKAEAV